MPRYSFGGGSSDYVKDTNGRPMPNRTLPLFLEQSLTTPVTDLLVGGAPATTVVTRIDGAIPLFQAPDGVTALWVDTGFGATRLDAYDDEVAAELAAADARAAAAEARLAIVEPVDTAVDAGIDRAVTADKVLTPTSARQQYPTLITVEKFAPANHVWGVDDTAIVQAFVNAVTAGFAHGFMTQRTYRITAPIVMGQTGSTRWQLDLGGATILQATSNTPIFHFRKESTSQFVIGGGGAMVWEVDQPPANTQAVAFYFDSDTNTNAGFFNFEIGNIEFFNGFRGIAINEASANRNPVWGADLHHLRAKPTMRGSLVRLRQTTSGQPNMTLRQVYVRADQITEPAIDLQGYHGVLLQNIEVNNSPTQDLLMTTCDAVVIDVMRSEGGSFTQNFTGLWTLSDCRATIRGLEVQFKTFTVTNFAYLLRLIGANTRVTVGGRSVSSLTVSSGQVAFIQGDDVRSIELAGGLLNGSSITDIYQFDNTPKKIVRNGRVSQAVTAHVFHSVDQSVPHNTSTVLTFDSERYDGDAMHDPAVNPSRLTVPAGLGGRYRLWVLATYAGNVTGQRVVDLRLNGTTVIASDQRQAMLGGFQTPMSVSVEYDLVPGDYVEVVCFQNSGAAVAVKANANYSPDFGMTLLGTAA